MVIKHSVTEKRKEPLITLNKSPERGVYAIYKQIKEVSISKKKKLSSQVVK